MKDRIGTYNDDGSVKDWPAKTLSGQDYNRAIQPHSTTRISSQHFVVLDLSPMSAEVRDKLLNDARASVTKPETPKGKVNESPRTGE